MTIRVRAERWAGRGMARGMARIACVVCAAVVCASPALAQNYVWTNSQGNNSFADLLNWTNNPPALTGTTADWRINSFGANRAAVTTAIGDVQRDISVGRGARGELFIGASGSFNATRDVYAGSTNASGNGTITVEGAFSATQDLLVGDALAEGRLLIEGGAVSVTRNMRLGRQGVNDGYGVVTINGGSLNVGQDLFTGQSNRLQNVFTLNSGTVAVTRDLFVASQNSNQSVVNIAGGRFTVGGAAVFSDGGSGPSTSFLNLSGDGAMTVAGAFSVANNSGTATATATIKDTASLAVGTNLRVGFGANSTATLNIEGGLISAPNGFTTFGEGAGSTVNVTMSGGSITGDRMSWANNATATATLNMTGGTINVVRTGTNATSGAFSMQAGTSTLNLGGTAVVNTEKLNINNGGLLTLGGDAIMNVTGATDGRATFDFSSGLVSGWGGVNGRIDFSSLGSVLQVTGTGQTITDPAAFSYNFADLFDAAIANGVFTQSVGPSPEFQFVVAYDSSTNLTTVSVVPEPSSVVLAVGGLALLVLAARGRRRS